MNDSLAHDDVAEKPYFAVYADEPTLIRLSGELDLDSAPELAAALEPLTTRGGTIRIDVADLTFMDSAGIGVLCTAARNVGERGHIVVLHPTPPVRRVIEITGLSEILAINTSPSTPHLAD